MSLLQILSNRPDPSPRRTMMAALASLYTSVKHREMCRIRYCGDQWHHRFADGTLVDRSLQFLSPGHFREKVRATSCREYVPEPGDVVVDVGAGVGKTAFVYSECVGADGEVHAIEAHPDTYECLASMKELNVFEQLVCHHFAVGATPGTVGISDRESWVSNTVFDGTSARRRKEVRRRRLDAFAAEAGIGEIDFLAMNIEGAEDRAIRGMTGILPRIRHLCIACHDFLADRTGNEDFRTKAAVEAFLADRGFRVVDGTDDRNRPWLEDYVYASRPSDSDSPTGGGDDERD